MTDQLATIEKVFILQNVELFANASPEELLHLANIAREVECGKEQIVFSEGDACDSFYVVVRGIVMLESRREQHSGAARNEPERFTAGDGPSLLVFQAIASPGQSIIRWRPTASRSRS